MTNIVLSSSGHCPTCNSQAEFVAYNEWLRDYFVCRTCGSIPRERALMHVIELFYPAWRNAVIHESSPSPRGASTRLANECARYMPSQFFLTERLGSLVNGMRCEDLENLTFANDSIDLHVSQDVIEHVYDPPKAFGEIARTLKPGGMHIFTTPLVNKHQKSLVRAQRINGQIQHFAPESYHDNPIGDGRSLVTVDWGFDICDQIHKASGLYTHVVLIDDMSRGIRAEFNEVLVSIKPFNK
jgi:transcription initiation factor TFIIIB Brf1 subunit/transcription initiation factor TFIIB